MRRIAILVLVTFVLSVSQVLAYGSECDWGPIPETFVIPDAPDGYITVSAAVNCETGGVVQLSAKAGEKQLGSTHGSVLILPVPEVLAGQQVCFSVELEGVWKPLEMCTQVPAPKVIRPAYTPDGTCQLSSKLLGAISAQTTSEGASVYPKPDLTLKSVSEIEAYTPVTILLGPVCIEHRYWYLIQSDDSTGWVPEIAKGVVHLSPR